MRREDLVLIARIGNRLSRSRDDVGVVIDTLQRGGNNALCTSDLSSGKIEAPVCQRQGVLIQ